MQQPSSILRFINLDILDEKTERIVRPLKQAANIIDTSLPNSAEKSAGLRKLVEAYDCFVRASQEAAVSPPSSDKGAL